MTRSIRFLTIFILCGVLCQAQEWTLKLRSRVELRNWKLTTRAEKSEKSLQGASIALSKGNTVIGQTTSNSDGDFEMDIPAKGEFILTINYAGCNTKRFYVSTNGVPDLVGKDNYKPTVSIGGFMMSKPLKGVDYLGLNEPLVKVEYKNTGQNFDKDETVTNKGMEIVSKIYDAENTVIEKFCSANKSGDDALNKLKNCPLAKEYYMKAMDLLPGEPYPVEQLAKAEQCIKNKQAESDAAALQAAKKAEVSKVANEKIQSEKTAKDKELFNKAAGNSVANNKKKEENKTASIQPKNSQSSNANLSSSDAGKANGKRKVPKIIGANKYKEAITRADDYFKTKRYSEAKSAYEEALTYKVGDIHASNRISEIGKLTASK